MNSRGTIVLAEITERAIDPALIAAAVANHEVGGTVMFVGTVRDHDRDRVVQALTYTAHPTGLGRLRAVLADVVSSFEVTGVAASHRVGALAIGDVAVVVAVAARHRGAAFDACEVAIDRIKAEVPIWKHQCFADGSDEWVGLVGDVGLA